MQPNCEKRNSSTVTPQSLMLMNGDYVLARASDLAQRVVRKAAKPADQIAHAWLLVYGREPTDDEVRTSLRFYHEQRQHFQTVATKKKNKKTPKPEELALASYCQALLSSNGFLYVD